MVQFHWEISYFTHWLTSLFYLTGGTIVVFAFASNKLQQYKEKITILNRLERYSRTQNEWFSDPQYLRELFNA